MAKKKNMTKAQAAAARHEETPESIKRARAKERTQAIKKSAATAQKRANKTAGFRAILPLLLLAGLIIAALAFTVVPGMMMGR